MPQITIRPFERCDQQAARALIVEGLGEHFGFIDATRNPDLDDIAANYLDPGNVFVIAQIDGKLIGTGALIAEDAHTGRIVRMSVRRQARRQGIGRALVENLVGISRQRGFRHVLVETNNNWADAIGLYERCGFVEYARDEVSVYLRLAIQLDQVVRR